MIKSKTAAAFNIRDILLFAANQNVFRQLCRQSVRMPNKMFVITVEKYAYFRLSEISESDSSDTLRTESPAC